MILGLISSFAAGIFISLALIHIMPEMSKTYYEEWAEDLDDAPLPAILMVIGYMLVLILD